MVGPEYRLFVAAKYKDTEQEFRTVVHLQTVREFASFRYELGIEEQFTNNNIRFRVTGLKAPQLSLPGSGPAFFHREYRNLHGTYQIVVEGLDRKSNLFEFEIQEKQVQLKKAPADSFIVVSTEFRD